MFGALADLWYRAGFGKQTFGIALRRLKGLPRSAFGTALAHFGFGVTVLGIVAVTTFETESVVEMKQGMTTEAGGYSLTFDGLRSAVARTLPKSAVISPCARRASRWPMSGRPNGCIRRGACRPRKPAS